MPPGASAIARYRRDEAPELGYDRVMVYRFDREGTGESLRRIGTAILSHTRPTLPRLDIPPQARRMHLAQRSSQC